MFVNILLSLALAFFAWQVRSRRSASRAQTRPVVPADEGARAREQGERTSALQAPTSKPIVMQIDDMVAHVDLRPEAAANDTGTRTTPGCGVHRHHHHF
jgi:hypothetical protein